MSFLPINKEEMEKLGWDEPDFVYVIGDAYVDHPSFGAAIISRMLEAQGYRVAILSQPDWHKTESFTEFGMPKLGFLVSAGNIDSMVAHYTVSKKRRNYDYYSPDGKIGLRPDRAVIVYCNKIREAYGSVPIIIGGLEASLRRFAHYDYWSNRVRNSILIDSSADILSYGMGERSISRIAELLNKGVPVGKIHDVKGTCYVTDVNDKVHYESVGGYEFKDLATDKKLYAESFGLQYRQQDSVNGKAITEKYGDRMVVQNPPAPPLEREELDKIYALPYERAYHPIYKAMGGVPAIKEVEFSITHNRGCFGACNFCALAFHQGRSVRSRSIDSVVKEAEILTKMPDFKGYIHDIGGPTANFRYPSCKKQLECGVCAERKCLVPTPCKNLEVDHTEYIELLKRVEEIKGIKKVFIRSGIRFDYLMYDKSDEFFKKLVKDHISGQLKVAPEHCCPSVLKYMGKPDISVYNEFEKKYRQINEDMHLDQYLVPYLISSHPGSTLNDAIDLACYLKNHNRVPEQVQDFYPTPGTVSTVMYYTGIDPLTMKSVYVTTDYKEKQMQRALLQWSKPENYDLVKEALLKAGRADLIGYGKKYLIEPQKKQNTGGKHNDYKRNAGNNKEQKKHKKI